MSFFASLAMTEQGRREVDMDVYNLVSFVGIFVLIGFAWVLSADKKNMNWRVITWGIGLQILIALFIFRVPAGSKIFLIVNDIVVMVRFCVSFCILKKQIYKFVTV